MAIADQLVELVAETLNLSADQISAQAGADDIEAWDSLAHINLMMSLEQSFGLRLEVEDFQRLTSVPAMIQYLAEQGLVD